MNSNALCSTYKDDKGNAKEWIVQSPKTKSSHLISTPETLFGDGKFLKENRKKLDYMQEPNLKHIIEKC